MEFISFDGDWKKKRSSVDLLKELSRWNVVFQERVPSVHIDEELDAQEEMASEEVTEETKTFQITGVTDGATGQMISFEEALKKVRTTHVLFSHKSCFVIAKLLTYSLT